MRGPSSGSGGLSGSGSRGIARPGGGLGSSIGGSSRRIRPGSIFRPRIPMNRRSVFESNNPLNTHHSNYKIKYGSSVLPPLVRFVFVLLMMIVILLLLVS